MTKRIEVTVRPDGKTKLETSGFVGKECMEYDKVLNTLSDEVETKKKAEYNANEQPSDVTIVGL